MMDEPTSGIRSEDQPQPADAGQGLVLRTRFFVLDWTLNCTHPTVTIDGQPREVPWGERFFPLGPGKHQLQVSYKYLGLAQAGKASMEIEVVPDQVVRVSYQTPVSVVVAFLPGKLTLEPSEQP
jgi:hypothetical protein